MSSLGSLLAHMVLSWGLSKEVVYILGSRTYLKNVGHWACFGG